MYHANVTLPKGRHWTKFSITKSMYRSPSQSVTEIEEFLSNFDKLLNHIKQFRPSFTIILGDFNARSKSWWPEDVTSHEGTHIQSLTTIHGLQQLISDPTHLLQIHHHALTLFLLTNQI